MCGRYALAPPISLSRDAEKALDTLELDLQTTLDQREGHYNVAPTQHALVVATGEKGVEAKALRWGLVPGWAKDIKIGAKMINARAETVIEKPAYRAAFKRRRCLVPASGYYEWKGEAGSKQPFYIHNPSGHLLMFAGLWEAWRPDDEAEWTRTFTIVTGAPGKVSGQVHDRQPVILPPADWNDWLTSEPDVAKDILDKIPEAELAFYPVSKAVNNVRNHGSQLIEEVRL